MFSCHATINDTCLVQVFFYYYYYFPHFFPVIKPLEKKSTTATTDGFQCCKNSIDEITTQMFKSTIVMTNILLRN